MNGQLIDSPFSPVVPSNLYCNLLGKWGRFARLFLNSCRCHMRLKAASILGHYLENAKKVVPQNMHFILDLFDYKLYYWSVL